MPLLSPSLFYQNAVRLILGYDSTLAMLRISISVLIIEKLKIDSPISKIAITGLVGFGVGFSLAS